MSKGERDRHAREAGEGGAAEGQAQEPVRAYRGFFPVVYGNEVEVKQGGGLIFIAKDELEIEQGGGQWMIGLRELEVEQGGCAVMIAGSAKVERGFIGVLLSGRTELKEGARVLMTLPQAIVAGAAAGVVLALAAWWSGANRDGDRASADAEIAGRTVPGI
ncbi:MAG TPA: hypothetical protein VK911_02560 [Vicinamibacterales bacterium]|nr:hypothetical protein [Vicinamibacterales bacterium]